MVPGKYVKNTLSLMPKACERAEMKGIDVLAVCPRKVLMIRERLHGYAITRHTTLQRRPLLSGSFGCRLEEGCSIQIWTKENN